MFFQHMSGFEFTILLTLIITSTASIFYFGFNIYRVMKIMYTVNIIQEEQYNSLRKQYMATQLQYEALKKEYIKLIEK